MDATTPTLAAQAWPAADERRLAALESALAELTEKAQRHFPQLAVEPSAWASWLARCLGAEATSEQVVGAHPGLYLACGLAQRLPRAYAVFEQETLPDVARALRRLGEAEGAVEELLQQVRQRLLVGPEGEARLAQYLGSGSFSAYATTVAARLMATHHRVDGRYESDEALLGLPAGEDFERLLARKDQRERFAAAFRQALASLTPRERSLLRLNLGDGVSIDQLAPVYRVSRATVARWIAAARELLAKRTRAALSENLQLPTDDLDSLMLSIQSGFDLSLRRFLREADDAGAPPP